MRFSATKIPYRFDNGSIIAAIVIMGVGLLLGLRQVNQFPAFTHAWAQADWYSVAIGFQNNGYDLFHPETLIYNKQFPGWWKVDYGNTVTAVDFPIHEYIVALLMGLFGTTAPWVFRGLTLLASLVGLWFLFLAARRLTGDLFKALLVTVVAMTSPLYAFYFNNYLPSAPALALAMAGLWAYARYYQEGRVVWWNLSVALLALATLERTSFAVPLVAVCAFEMLRILRHESVLCQRWLAPLVAAAAIGGYLLWNAHLWAANGSLFLNLLMPPRHWEDVRTVFDEMHWHWRFEYFSRLQHWVVAVACIAALVLLMTKHKRGGQLSLGWLSGIWWLGEVCFFVAMMRQYRNHDYYFLDTFFLPSLFTFVLALRALPAVKGHLPSLVALAVLLLLGGAMYSEAGQKVKERCWEGDRAYGCAQHFADADRWFDEEGIPQDARLLALLAYPQNGPFIQMQRKGYTVMEYDEELMDSVRKFPFDYIVVENDVYAQFVAEHPDDEFSHKAECVADNGTLSLYIYHTDETL